MGKTNMRSLKYRKKIPTKLDKKAPFCFLFSMSHNSTLLIFFKLYLLEPIIGIYRLLSDFTILTPPVKPNQGLNPSPTPSEFLDWTDILALKADPWAMEPGQALSGLLRTQGNTWGTRALPGLGEREGMWQKDSLRDPCGWIWLLSLEMLSTQADTPSGCYKPGYQTTLTCATWLSLLLPATGSHGRFAKYRGEWEAKVALGSSVLALVYGAATSENMKK